jgi:hypothetical protein
MVAPAHGEKVDWAGILMDFNLVRTWKFIDYRK